MTESTLAFQPEAERYYAEGYWRDGDLWDEFDARASEHPERVALVLDDRQVTYDELRRAAIGVSNVLGQGGVQPGEVVILLGRHSIESVVSMLGCLHRGVVLAPLPPMFNETQLAALVEQTQAAAIVTFGGEKEIAKCREVAGDRVRLVTVRPEDVDAYAAQRPAGRAKRAPRGRPDGGPALVGHDLRAEGRRALQQHPALRDRGPVPALGPHGRRHLPDRRRVRLRRRPRLRLPAGPAQRRHGRPAEPLEAGGRPAADRGARLHVRAGDADPRRRHDPRGERDRSRPLLHARARRPGPDAGAPPGHEGRVRRPAARRLRPLRGPRPRRPCARRSRGEDPADRGAPV